MALKPGLHVYCVAPEEAGSRLDVFLSRRAQDCTRSGASRLIRDGRVRVGRKPVKPGLLLAAGDEVVLDLPAPAPAQAVAEALPLNVVYEDDDLAVIDKPAGMVTHPAAGHERGTLVNAALYHLKNLSGIGGSQRPGIVHRLDKDTSGLMLVAKNDRAHQALCQGIQAREVRRRYEVVVWGRPAQAAFTVANRIGRDPKDRKRFAVVARGGKEAVTHFKRLQEYGDFTRLEATLETGRTHQIRVHCRTLNLPVVGDRNYGRRSETASLQRLGLARPARQLLHASHLEFLHPVNGQPLAFHAPWPEDFARFLRALEPSDSRFH